MHIALSLAMQPQDTADLSNNRINDPVNPDKSAQPFCTSVEWGNTEQARRHDLYQTLYSDGKPE